MDWFRLIFSTLLCGPAFLASAFFLVIQFARGRHADPEADEATAKRHSRRRLGAGLVLLISAVFFVGVNHLDPTVDPLSWVWMWFVVGLLLMWLFCLAMLDLRQTVLEHRVRRESFQENLQTWLRTRKDG